MFDVFYVLPIFRDNYFRRPVTQPQTHQTTTQQTQQTPRQPTQAPVTFNISTNNTCFDLIEGETTITACLQEENTVFVF